MAIGKGAVLLHGVNSAITSSEHVALGDANAVIVELFPSGINPVGQFQLLDSAEEATGYYPVLDPAGLQTGLTPNTVNKYLVPNVLPFVRIRVTPTSGSWSARVTPVLATQPSATSAVAPPSPGTLFDGTLTAGAAAPLPSHPCAAVLVENDPTSATDVYVGSATSQSVRLQPGQSEVLTVSNSGLVSVAAVSGTPRVNWHAA